MVLAETLNGLDAVSVGGEFFRGAPIIVYMWLLERHRFVSGAHTRIGILYTPGLFFRCSIPYSFTRIRNGWTRILSENMGYIRWYVRWWHLRFVVLSTGGQNYVRIQGLHRTSFYIPSRELRQFNVPQTIAPIPRDFFADSTEVDVRLALRLVVMWEEHLGSSSGPGSG